MEQDRQARSVLAEDMSRPSESMGESAECLGSRSEDLGRSSQDRNRRAERLEKTFPTPRTRVRDLRRRSQVLGASSEDLPTPPDIVKSASASENSAFHFRIRAPEAVGTSFP